MVTNYGVVMILSVYEIYGSRSGTFKVKGVPLQSGRGRGIEGKKIIPSAPGCFKGAHVLGTTLLTPTDGSI